MPSALLLLVLLKEDKTWLAAMLVLLVACSSWPRAFSPSSAKSANQPPCLQYNKQQKQYKRQYNKQYIRKQKTEQAAAGPRFFPQLCKVC
jgi:hypothetical protein